VNDLIGKDAALRTVQQALDGLSLRQQTISKNLANIDTPGYRARSVNFEAALKAASKRESMALATDHPGHRSALKSTLSPLVQFRPGGSERADGNNVDIDVELLDMSETGILYQALSQAASKKLLLLKNIAMAR
jgi:flagellar basal-body rod protein FlgB